MTKQSLAEEITIRKAHQETETRLNFLCTELKSTLESTTSDLQGYQEKLGTSPSRIFLQLERKSQIEEDNREQWALVQRDLTTLATNLERRIASMSNVQLSKSTEMDKIISSFLEAETKHLDEIHSFIDSQLSLFEKQRQLFESDLTNGKSTGDLVLGEIKVLREDIKQRIGEGLSGLNSAAHTISQEIVDALVGFQQQVTPSIDPTSYQDS